jgi:hypothetical protein
MSELTLLTVEYRRLHTTGNYCNETVGATARVNADQTAEDTLAALRRWVDRQLGRAEEANALRDKVWRMQAEASRIEADLGAARSQWQRAEAFLKRHGVDVREPVPF